MHIDGPEQGASHVCEGGQKRWQGVHRLRRDRCHVQPIIDRSILSGYGLTLTDPKKLPANFAKVVKKDGKETIVFEDTSRSYSAKSMNQILSAYSRADGAR